MDLNSEVGSLPLVGPIYQTRLLKMGIEKVGDLLNHIPSRYIDYTKTTKINLLEIGESVTIEGEIKSMKNQYTRYGKKLQLAEVFDGTGIITVVWFNQPYLVTSILEGETYSFSGKVDWFGRRRAMISPEYEKVVAGKEKINTGRLVPVYPETYGISSKWMRGRIKYAFDNSDIKEFLPKETLKQYNFKDLKTSLREVHFPKEVGEAKVGRERLAFNELLFLQLTALKRRSEWRKNKASYNLKLNQKDIDKFIQALPFKLTKSQEEVIAEIENDLAKPFPMNRLLEGDVGSGKTVVAALSAFISFLNGYQSVFMAPTQILAQQHFNTLNNLLQPFKVRISLIISAITERDLGRSDIFVGTHSLIHQKIDFDKVSLVVIDEQHRFGVEQREHLAKKTGKGRIAPHILTMTATPIPRTVALTFYGDLDLSTLDEIPKGRQKILTKVVKPEKREGAYSWIDKKIAEENSQVFVVCPLIEESDKEGVESVKAVKNEYERLKKIFKKRRLGLLHGKQKITEKNKTLNDFRNGKTDILVATPVVEVGLDIPNATIMVIEGAERFGLSQLHQLRGRVGRGEKKSYCLLFSESKTENVLTRLEAMEKGISGFKLAELDLKLRGPGEIFGLRQHGIPELKIASWQDISLIRRAKTLAEQISNNKNSFKEVFETISKTQKIPN